MDKKHGEKPTLEEILDGVDIVGTMLDQELPEVRRALAEIKTLLSRPRADTAGISPALAHGDIMIALTEIREMLEQQEQRLLKLDARLAQMEADFMSNDDGPVGEVH